MTTLKHTHQHARDGFFKDKSRRHVVVQHYTTM